MQRYLITGGTGFLGKALTKYILDCEENSTVTIFSRSESRQAIAKKELLEYKDRIIYLLGDVVNYQSVLSATNNIDTVVHAAALKRIDSCQDNPILASEVNITGTINIIRACNINKVKTLCFISSDKASRPCTTYGATKYVGEQLVRKSKKIKTNCFSVRYGNVLGSTGSIIDIWKDQFDKGEEITVTEPTMTRFFWTVDDACKFVKDKLANPRHGEIHVPELKAMKIYDLARYLYPDSKIKIIGCSHNEKIHEELYQGYESSNYVISPEEFYGTNNI